MGSARKRARFWLPAVGAAGVALGHAVAYVLATPDPHERAKLLHATGHSYWPWFVSIAIGAAVGGLAFYAFERYRRPSIRIRTLFGYAVIRLVALQCVGFIALEAIERIGSGHLDELWTEPAFVVGLGVQVVLGIFGALVLVAADRVVRKFVAVPRRGAPVAVSSGTERLPRRNPALPKPALLAGAASLRGPPFLLHV